MQRFVHSKWSKTQALITNPSIQSHIPETQIMREETLRSMLSKYKMVYVKPDRGSFGNGVIRVEETQDGYRYQSGTRINTFTSFDSLHHDLVRATKNRRYLVQKGIHLLKYKGRRFDIRVMVQKNLSKRWEATAMVGRVAHPRKIVTNYHNGGKLVVVPELLAPHMDDGRRNSFIHELKVLGVAVARQLESRYPGIKEIGLDVAVDRDRNAWILEVNTCPDPYIFRILKDKRVSRRVIRYAKAYGRIKSSTKLSAKK